MNALNECYSAFAVAVVYGCTMESAFDKLDPKVEQFGNRDTSKKIPDEDIPWLVEQRTKGAIPRPGRSLWRIRGSGTPLSKAQGCVSIRSGRKEA